MILVSQAKNVKAMMSFLMLWYRWFQMILLYMCFYIRLLPMFRDIYEGDAGMPSKTSAFFS